MKARLFLACTAVLAASSFADGQKPDSSAEAAQPYRITLAEAIHKGLQANLNVLLAETRVDQAEAARQRRLAAALLPRINAEAYANVQNRNLRAFGLSFSGLPAVVGPFSNYDIRVYAQQNVLDLASYRNLKASEQSLNSTRFDEKDARDLIVRAVAALYLNAESAAARASAAEFRVNDADVLLKLAMDRHDAGAATGVDVLRAQVQLANERQSLLIAQNQYKQAILQLARDIGLSPSNPIQLAESLEYRPLAEPTAEFLVNSALAARADYLSLSAQKRAIAEKERANRARSYPKLSINGNYGGIGRSIGGIEPTGMIQGQIDFTLFDRDRDGEVLELAAQMRAVDERIADLRRGIEQDVLSALLNLESARQQVDVARQGQELARRELEMSKDRFQQGTTNNVEVITAQDAVARAEENYILAVSNYVDGEFGLARAIGDTERNVSSLSTR